MHRRLFSLNVEDCLCAGDLHGHRRIQATSVCKGRLWAMFAGFPCQEPKTAVLYLRHPRQEGRMSPPGGARLSRVISHQVLYTVHSSTPVKFAHTHRYELYVICVCVHTHLYVCFPIALVWLCIIQDWYTRSVQMVWNTNLWFCEILWWRGFRIKDLSQHCLKVRDYNFWSEKSLCWMDIRVYCRRIWVSYKD